MRRRTGIILKNVHTCAERAHTRMNAFFTYKRKIKNIVCVTHFYRRIEFTVSTRCIATRDKIKIEVPCEDASQLESSSQLEF